MRPRLRTIVLLLCLGAPASLLWAGSQDTNVLRGADRTRIAEAVRLAAGPGEHVWPGWTTAPFTILLVAPEREVLLWHPAPTPDFTRAGDDPVLKTTLFTRPRVFEPNLLASFPAVGNTPTVVIGQPEHTSANTSMRWTLTLLHEHFHQWQYSLPGYYEGIGALGLASGDQQGGWILNYLFPYESANVAAQYSVMAARLADAIPVAGANVDTAKLDAYLNAKRQFRALISANDYKYLSFQLWQEGVARYTEYAIAARAAAGYEPSQAFLALADVTTFEAEARAQRERTNRGLRTVQLATAKRSAFYALGAGEALLLDAIQPGWRKGYASAPYTLDGFFPGSK